MEHKPLKGLVNGNASTFFFVCVGWLLYWYYLYSSLFLGKLNKRKEKIWCIDSLHKIHKREHPILFICTKKASERHESNPFRKM